MRGVVWGRAGHGGARGGVGQGGARGGCAERGVRRLVWGGGRREAEARGYLQVESWGVLGTSSLNHVDLQYTIYSTLKR